MHDDYTWDSIKVRRFFGGMISFVSQTRTTYVLSWITESGDWGKRYGVVVGSASNLVQDNNALG